MKQENKLCDCHSEQMVWVKRSDRKFGGVWRCKIKKREEQRRHRLKNIERDRKRKREYRKIYYKDVIRKDPIKMMKLQTQARLKYYERIYDIK